CSRTPTLPDAPGVYYNIAEFAGYPRLCQSTRAPVSSTAPWFGSRRPPFCGDGFIRRISSRLAVRLRGFQAFNGTLWVTLRQQCTALLQRRLGPVEAAQGGGEIGSSDTRGTGLAYGLACPIDTRHRPRYACFGLARHLHPQLTIGIILPRLGNHGVDLVALFKPLHGPVSGLLLLVLLRQPGGLIHSVLDVSDAAIGWCQSRCADPGSCRGFDCLLCTCDTLCHGRKAPAEVGRGLLWLR